MIIDSLLFSGGGTKGVAFSGVLKYYLEKNIDWGQRRPKLKKIGGVSIGSLFALLLVLGYSCNEIAQLAQTLDGTCFVNFDVTRIVLQNHVSLDSGVLLHDFLETLIVKKLKCEKLTLKQLHEKTGIELLVFVTHLDSGSLEIAEDSNYVIDALKASMSLPPLFPPQRLLRNNEQHYFADGGIVNNFPLYAMPTTTLGFNLIQRRFQMHDILASPKPFLSYLASALEIAVRSSPPSPEESKRTINIECGGTHGSYELHLSDAARKQLFEDGYAAAKSRHILPDT
jgi:predicted acylesterase/phospholipase RssA